MVHSISTSKIIIYFLLYEIRLIINKLNTIKLLNTDKMRSSLIHFKRLNTLFHYRLASSYAVHELQADQYGVPYEVLKLNHTTTIDSNQLKANDVLIQLLGSPINPADINMVEGKYALLPHHYQQHLVMKVFLKFLIIVHHENKLRPGDWVIPKIT